MATPVSRAAKIEISQRMSYLSNTSQAKDGEYEAVKTPDILEGGALREGGAPSLLSKEYVGVIAQYAAVGLIDSVLPSTIYPLMQSYLNASGTQIVTASTLIALPWSFKVFYGILSDCVPIHGYRRRPYMVLGWLICFAMLLIMASSPVGAPYFSNPDDANIAPEDYHLYPGIEDTFNLDAPDKGNKYVLLMMFSAFGYLMADVCADGIVVQLAQQEPENVRGTTQTAIYGTRTAMNVVGSLITGFAFNGKQYGGTFDWSLSFPTLMIILTCCLAPVIPITWFFIKEQKIPRAVFSDYIRELWAFIQNRAVYQVIFYNFFSGVVANFSYTVGSPIQRYWVHVTPINNSVSTVISNFVFMAGIFITGKWGLHWNWRWVIVVTGVLVIIVDMVVTLLVIWDVYRNQWFWLGPPLAVQVPAGISFIISTFVTVELAGEGNEGAVYGLLTTVSNLSSPFSSTLTKIVDQKWHMTNERIQNDDRSIRSDVTKAVMLMYAMSVASWLFLPLLPKQKAQTQELKRTGGTSKLFGGLTVFYISFALVWSVMTNLMGIFSSTSCLVIAGGDGC
ncbi:Folate-biopterin transporter, partial [Globisporangium splendens]